MISSLLNNKVVLNLVMQLSTLKFYLKTKVKLLRSVTRNRKPCKRRKWNNREIGGL